MDPKTPLHCPLKLLLVLHEHPQPEIAVRARAKGTVRRTRGIASGRGQVSLHSGVEMSSSVVKQWV